MGLVSQERRFARVAYPWRASVDLSSPWPGRFYGRLMSQALRYGNPARRRFGRLHVAASKIGVPEGAALSFARLRPRQADPMLVDLLDALGARWPDIAARDPGLPSRVAAPSVLALERSAGLTVFVFGEGADPLVVLKLREADDSALALEARALTEAEGTGAAPRYLGSVDRARAQEALKGAPLLVRPVTPAGAAGLRWEEPHDGMGRALVALAHKTAHDAAPQELSGQLQAAVEAVEGNPGRLVRAALGDLRGRRSAVLRHGDTSAQNSIVSDDRLAGFVDWELARFDGAPGFDMWNAAVAFVDHGVGLVRWSQERALASFKKAWMRSELFDEARKQARAAASAAGVPPDAHDKLEVAFFARRLASRLARPDHYATGPRVALEMLEFVCARS